MDLEGRVKKALVDIGFLEKYGAISQEYNPEHLNQEERLEYLDGEEVMDIISRLGYKPAFDRKEKFYTVSEIERNGYEYKFNIILTAGMVDMVWVIKKNDELILGSPIGTFSKRIDSKNPRIKKPVFGTYEELEIIINRLVKLYEEFIENYISY